jgi:hypothetical protein
MLPVTVQFIVAMLAYGLNKRMVRKAEYLREENRVLKEGVRPLERTVTGCRAWCSNRSAAVCAGNGQGWVDPLPRLTNGR